MSLIECDDCGLIFNSDDDPEAIIDAPDCVPLRRALDTIMCVECRERAWVRANERALEEGR